MAFGKHIGIVPDTAVEFIVAFAADEGVVTAFSFQCIVSASAVQNIALTASVQGIVTAMSVQFVSARPSVDGFIGIRSLQSQTILHQVVQRNGLVGKLEFDVSIFIAPKVIADFDRIIAVIAEQFQIAVDSAEMHLARINAVETEHLLTLSVRHIV